MAREKGMNLPRTSYGLNTQGGNGIGIGRRDLLLFLRLFRTIETLLLTHYKLLRLLRLILIPKNGESRYV